MTFLGMPREKQTNGDIDSSDSLTTSDNIRREVESDADHREMTRTYGCDDYLSRWLPNIKRESDESGLLRSKLERMERKVEKEQPARLFKSPCHHHEGRKSTLKGNKIQSDPTKKTYFEAIKCSPMKLRQSLATFKRPKLDENLTLKPRNGAAINPRTREHTTDLSNSMESFTEKGLVESKTAKPRTSLGIVEMRSNEPGELGSLCFHKSLPETQYIETSYSMAGGKLRKLQRETDTVLLTGRSKQKELLVRCESIMIYPKVLVNQKQQTDKYKSINKPDKPKEAWKDNSLIPQPPTSPKTSENYTRLPQVTTDQTPQQVHDQNSAPDVTQDNSLWRPGDEPRSIPNSASTKIIIPFGENELRRSFGKGAKISPSQNEAVAPKAEGHDGSMKGGAWSSLHKEDGVEVSIKKAGGGEWGIPIKPRCLKESSKLNEQTQSAQRYSGITLGSTQHEVFHKRPVATQYLTVTTPNSPLRRFRIPTGVENTELYIGRENYPPKRTVPLRFPYSQRGIVAYTKGFDGIAVKQGDYEDIRRGNLSLKIGGRGLLKESIFKGEQLSGELVEPDDSKKRVQFLLQKSRYFTQ